MKALLVLSLLVVSGTAHAFDTITCKGRDGYSTPSSVTMTLTAVKKTVDEVSEGVRVPYNLVLKNNDDLWLDIMGKASQEDVSFDFSHQSGTYGVVTAYIYMDELDQAGVVVNGTRFHMDCGSAE